MPPQRCEDIILIEPDLELIIVRIPDRPTSHFLQNNIDSTHVLTQNIAPYPKFKESNLKTWFIFTGLILVGMFTFVMKLKYGDRYYLPVQ